MKIQNKSQFVDVVKSFSIKTKYIVVKPNWVSIDEGEYTEAEILEWLFEALPQEKIVIESYTPWRGLKQTLTDKGTELKTDLVEGQKFWDFYKEQDEHFLNKTGIGEVLKKFNAQYLNVTNEYWSGNCVSISEIETLCPDLIWKELYSYIPQKLFNIRKEVTLISLAKIKLEEENKNIIVSLSVKNLFGLIPHPSRREPFHRNNHTEIPQVISDVYKLYTSLFPNTLSINEGIKSMVRSYCEPNQMIEKDQNLVFADKDLLFADTLVCEQFGINPQTVPYFKLTQGK